MPVTFLPPQLGTVPDTPLPYTASPWKLLWEDICLFFRSVQYLPGIVLPLTPWNSGDLDELYPSLTNIGGVALQLVLSLAQLLFLVSLPILLACMIPALWIFIYMAAFLLLNNAVCDLFLNGGKSVLESRVPKKEDPKYQHEYWIFINGVGAGQCWLQHSIDRLGYTFGRKVTGVHNPTAGLVFDIIQCLVQRNFSYSTQDVRDAYALTKAALLDRQHEKVVLIVHSQGAIEAGLIIDWLLDEIPQGLLRKLEIYTFGNAANHFNNPYQAPAKLEISCSTNSQYSSVFEKEECTILHIEHYANSGDFVSTWGILNFINIPNRYMGQVFVRQGSGHQFNQHYMDTMFTLGKDHKVLDSNAFMDTEIELAATAARGHRELVGKDTKFPVQNAGLSSSNGAATTQHNRMPSDTPQRLRVKDLSRLWLYRNGGFPKDVEAHGIRSSFLAPQVPAL